MGQSSSQVAPSQVQQIQNADHTHEAVRSSGSLSNGVRIQKRSLSPTEDAHEMLPKAKKPRTQSNDASTAKRKSRRSMPQHRRGTTILPTQEVADNKASDRAAQTHAKQPAFLPDPTAKSSQLSEDQQSESDVVPHHSPPKAKMNDKGRAESGSATKGTGQKGYVAVSLVGNPGPRKRKRTSSIPTEAAQRNVTADSTRDEGQNVKSISKMANNATESHDQEVAAAKRPPAPTKSVERSDLPREQEVLYSPGTDMRKHARVIHRHMRQMDRDPEFKKAYDKETDSLKRADLIDAWIVKHDLQHIIRIPKARIDAQLAKLDASNQGRGRLIETDGTTEDAIPRLEMKATSSRHEKKPREATKESARAIHDTGNAGRATTSSAKKTQARTDPDMAHPSLQPIPEHAHSSAALPADPMLTPPVSQEKVATKASGLNDDAQVVIDNGDVMAGAEDDDEHEEDYDPHVREGYVDPSDQIKEWLSSQASAAPPDEIGPSFGSPKVATTHIPSRKRVSREFADDIDEYEDDAGQQDGELETETPPKKNVKRTAPNRPEKSATQQSAAASEGIGRGTVKGAWSDEEIALADSIFTSCCSVSNISALQMKRNITDWKTTGMFKEEVLEAFPLRTKAAIRKFCHRRYHPHNAGPWTEEEDEILKRKVTELGNDWVTVGDYVNRTAQACKDRWSKILQLKETMERGPWNAREEERLTQAVEDLLETLKEECDDEEVANDSERLEMMIDWKKVSEKLDGRRSAKRCHEKWKAIGRRPIVAVEDEILQRSAEKLQKAELSKKQKRLGVAYDKLGWQDVLDALQEITTSCAGVSEDKNFQYESTLWSLVGTKNANSRFPPKLRRRCYLELLEKFGSLRQVKTANGIVGKARAMEQELLRLKSRGKMEFTTTLPDKPFKTQQKKAAPPTDANESQAVASQPCKPTTHAKKDANVAAARRSSSAKPKKSQLSKELVDENDDEDMIDDTVAGAEADASDDARTAPSVHSRYDIEARTKTPKLPRDDFLHRCMAVDRKQRRHH